MLDALSGHKSSLSNIEIQEDSILTLADESGLFCDFTFSLEFLFELFHCQGECWIKKDFWSECKLLSVEINLINRLLNLNSNQREHLVVPVIIVQLSLSSAIRWFLGSHLFDSIGDVVLCWREAEPGLVHGEANLTG